MVKAVTLGVEMFEAFVEELLNKLSVATLQAKKSRVRLPGRGGFLRLFCTLKRVIDAHEECEW